MRNIRVENEKHSLHFLSIVNENNTQCFENTSKMKGQNVPQSKRIFRMKWNISSLQMNDLCYRFMKSNDFISLETMYTLGVYSSDAISSWESWPFYSPTSPQCATKYGIVFVLCGLIFLILGHLFCAWKKNSLDIWRIHCTITFNCIIFTWNFLQQTEIFK